MSDHIDTEALRREAESADRNDGGVIAFATEDFCPLLDEIETLRKERDSALAEAAAHKAEVEKLREALAVAVRLLHEMVRSEAIDTDDDEWLMVRDALAATPTAKGS